MGQGCPLCKESHLEKEMRVFLDENGINYTPQARFNWLRTNDTKKKMSLDYYIKDLNVAIECQGIQHFNAKRFWNNNKDKEEEVKKIKKRDKLKKKLCEKHGIKVLYYSNLGIKYPYEVFEDKEKLLEEILKSEELNISLQKTENT
jgi:PP-loop superfamily ATP-utilizing enzyme